MLLIAAHGERGGAGDNARLASVAAMTAARLPGWDVRHGVLSGTPSLEEALADVGDRHVTVWPFFLCDGYFIQKGVRRRLEAMGCDHTLLPEFGAYREVAEVALDMLASEGREPPGAILVAAHGSTKSAQSREATERFAEWLRELGCDVPVTCAYLEEPTFVADALPGLPRGAAIVSLFAGAGLHGGEDLPRLVAEASREDLRIVTPARCICAVAGIIAAAAAADGQPVPLRAAAQCEEMACERA